MKKRNVGLEHNSLLTNHICKYIVLEAPTVAELEKKIKNYKALLIEIVTNAYRITNLTLDQDSSYNTSSNQNYQVGILFNFDGKRKDTIMNPVATVHHLKQLAALESKKHHTSHIARPLDLTSREITHIDAFEIEVENEKEIDDAISNKQREYMEHLISTSNLTNIAFYPKSKNKNLNTGKIKIEMSIHYKVKEIHKKQHFNNKQEER